MRNALLLVLLSACTPEYWYYPEYTKPPQDWESAAALVWEHLGESTEDMPTIEWVTCDCIEELGVEFGPNATGCHTGAYFHRLDDIYLTIRSDRVSGTSLTHELIHAMLWRSEVTGCDPLHKGPVWGAVDPLNFMLANQGL